MQTSFEEGRIHFGISLVCSFLNITYFGFPLQISVNVVDGKRPGSQSHFIISRKKIAVHLAGTQSPEKTAGKRLRIKRKGKTRYQKHK